MIGTTSPIRNFSEGKHYPSPVTQIIGLGFYDGVTNGLLRTADESVYAFDMVGEILGSDEEADRRRFELKPLPSDAFELIVSAIAPYRTPEWPCWIPIWKFPDPESMAAVDSLIDKQLKRAGSPAWVVETSDLLRGIISAQRQEGHHLLIPPSSNNGTTESSVKAARVPDAEPKKK